MNFEAIMPILIYGYFAILGLILVACAGIAGFGFWLIGNWAIDRWQGFTRKRRYRMASPMNRDELMERRLAKHCERIASTMRVANR
jgi:hypothetical protein